MRLKYEKNKMNNNKIIAKKKTNHLKSSSTNNIFSSSNQKNIYLNKIVNKNIGNTKLSNENIHYNDNILNFQSKMQNINSNDEKSETSSQSNDNIEWNYSTAKGELKCREDKENNLNVLFMNNLYMEKDEELTIAKCAELFYSNDKQIVIITSGFWSNDNNVEAAYIYAQLLFPNLDIKFNMAMKQTPLNEKYFEANKNSFLDLKKR